MKSFTARFAAAGLAALLAACNGGGSSSSYVPAGSSSNGGRINVRFVEGSPLLEADQGGGGVPLGTTYLTVNGLTVANAFPYGSVTSFTHLPAGTLSLTMRDSIGFSVGPLETPSLAKNASYTVVVVGSFPKYSVLVFTEPSSSSGAGLSVYEASPAKRSVDFGRFKASTHTNFTKLGTARYGVLATKDLGAKVTDFGGYAGTGTKPMTGGAVAVTQVNAFDADGALPFENSSRLSLFVLDPSPGSAVGPVIGTLDQ